MKKKGTNLWRLPISLGPGYSWQISAEELALFIQKDVCKNIATSPQNTQVIRAAVKSWSAVSAIKKKIAHILNWWKSQEKPKLLQLTKPSDICSTGEVCLSLLKCCQFKVCFSVFVSCYKHSHAHTNPQIIRGNLFRGTEAFHIWDKALCAENCFWLERE